MQAANNMDFSECYKASIGPAPCFSPNGRYLASTVEYRLIIREVETLRIAQLYSCLDRIDVLQWSCNSLYVLCGLCSRAVVQIWSVDQPEWTCKIDEGPAGVGHVSWTPDGLGVVIMAQFQIRITLWSLLDKKCTYLRGPKHSKKGLAFSPDGNTLAVLERHDCKDHVTLYNTKGWQQLSRVQCDTNDAADLSWSPQGTYLAVWDSSLDYRVCILDSQGNSLSCFSAYQDALGVKEVSWNPSGQMLAVGSFDKRVRLLTQVTWQQLMQCDHPSKLSVPEHVVVYQEVVEGSNSQYVVAALPAALPTVQPVMDDADLQLGADRIRWSPDSQFLVTHEASMPNVLWVWDMAVMELAAVLVHTSPITDARWAPQGCTLAVVTATGKVYMWTPAGASIVHIPLTSFSARSITWNPRGGSFCLTDRNVFCCAYVSSTEETL